MNKIIAVSALIICFSYHSLGNAQFYFEDFSSVEDLNLIGNALQIGDTLGLNLSAAWQTSAVWHSTKQEITNGFEVSFQFQVDQLTSYAGHWGADGFAFVIQNNSDSTIGGGGGDMGYSGIPNSIAIEFDTWDNNVTGQTNIQDPNANHISVNTNGTEANNVEHAYSLGIVSDLNDFSDGMIHEVCISYDGDSLDIYLDSLTAPLFSVQINIEDSLQLDEGRAWVGFTSSTGLAAERHNIVNWSFNANLLGIGSEISAQIAGEFELNQNYPNPFNPVTKIDFTLPEPEFTTLQIYDILGREVSLLVSDKLNPGHHTCTFDGKNLASGVYYYQLQAGDYREVKKMILLR